MQRSDERILTTHTGSLPRPAELMPLLTGAESSGTKRDRQRERVGAAVAREAEARSDQFRSDLTNHRQAETRS